MKFIEVFLQLIIHIPIEFNEEVGSYLVERPFIVTLIIGFPKSIETIQYSLCVRETFT